MSYPTGHIYATAPVEGLGHALVAMRAGRVRAVSLGDDPEHLHWDYCKIAPCPVERVNPDTDWMGMVLDVLEGRVRETSLGLELDVWGTPFQRDIWAAIQKVPYGETVGYGELTHRAHFTVQMVRATAMACSQNRLAVLIPCHRVIPTEARLVPLPECPDLGGYRWGAARKRFLLQRERRAMLLGKAVPA